MDILEDRLEKIYRGVEKLLSLHTGLKRKLVELESVNQGLSTKIKELEEEISKAKNDLDAQNLENKKINQQNQQEINHKINELLSEVERCLTLLKR